MARGTTVGRTGLTAVRHRTDDFVKDHDMTIFGNAFGAGNGGDQDIGEAHTLNLPKGQSARHYAREADKATGSGNGQKR